MIHHRALLVPCILLAAQPGQAQRQTAPDSAITAAAAAIVRSADACAAVWPGYWHPGKAFGFSRQADSSIFVHVSETPPAPYELVRDAPARLYRRRGYPQGFGGIDLQFRMGAVALPIVHAYTAARGPIIQLLYHEAFHGHQWQHFADVAGGRPAFSSTLAPVALSGSVEDFERLASAERAALDTALAAPADSVRSRARTYLALRARRAALSPAVQDVERYEEQTEGTAEYVGQRCTEIAVDRPGRARAGIRAQLAADHPALRGGRPSKWRAYGVGGAISLLLDDLGMEGWQAAVAAGEPLDVLLQRAVEVTP